MALDMYVHVNQDTQYVTIACIDLHSIQYIRELIVPKRLMSVLPIHVKMVPRASMH